MCIALFAKTVYTYLYMFMCVCVYSGMEPAGAAALVEKILGIERRRCFLTNGLVHICLPILLLNMQHFITCVSLQSKVPVRGDICL